MVKISVVINTLNEEENLPRAITSIRNIADEIIVVDMHSDDKTQEVARSLGAKVFEHERTGYVEPARNFAIEKASGKWILVLDADEQIPNSLAGKIKDIVAKPEADYYSLPRKNIIFGKWIRHSRWWPDYNIRFFKKGFVSWSEIIHSIPTTKGVGRDLEASVDNAIVHHHYDSIEQYIDRLNRYTTHHSELLIKGGYKFNWKDLIIEPVSEFLSRYFQAEGYKDGIHGLALSLLQSFSEFVVFLKVWQHDGFEPKEVEVKNVVKVMKDVEKEMFFWQADAQIKEGGGLIERAKRKLRLP
jgi:glycosyltransferase involved in cell wall biosynthesis